jgi:hypothetical protein
METNFGLSGIRYSDYYYDDEYDHLFKRLKEKLEQRRDRKDDRKQRKDDKRAERQEKRELNTEKKRLKNELKQTQIDERKANLNLLTQQAPGTLSLPGAPTEDKTTMIVAAVVGVIALGGIGYMVMNKKAAVKAAA